MSTADVEEQISEIRDRGTQYAARVQDDLSQADRDESLSDLGRRQAKDDIKERGSAGLRTYREQEEQILNDAILGLERRIDSRMGGNTASDIIAFRDAQDRADRFDDSDEAARILSRAIRSDDRSLAHAIYQRSVRENWHDVTKQFTDAFPDIKETAADLQRLNDIRADTFARTVQYGFFA